MNETPPVDPQPWMAEPVSNAVQSAATPAQVAATPAAPAATSVSDTVAHAVAQANQAAQSAQADAQAQIDAAMKAAQHTQDSILQANQAAMAMAQGGGTGMLLAMYAVYMVVMVVMVASCWKIFTKAGKPGWASIVPIYNLIVILEIVGRPVWWIVLMLIPFVNFIVGIVIALDLARKFGKSTAFGIGLALLGPIFLPMLAFGSATYNKDA